MLRLRPRNATRRLSHFMASPDALFPKLGPSHRPCESERRKSLRVLGMSRSLVGWNSVSYGAGGLWVRTRDAFRTRSSRHRCKDLCCRRKSDHWVATHENLPEHSYTGPMIRDA